MYPFNHHFRDGSKSFDTPRTTLFMVSINISRRTFIWLEFCKSCFIPRLFLPLPSIIQIHGNAWVWLFDRAPKDGRRRVASLSVHSVYKNRLIHPRRWREGAVNRVNRNLVSGMHHEPTHHAKTTIQHARAPSTLVNIFCRNHLFSRDRVLNLILRWSHLFTGYFLEEYSRALWNSSVKNNKSESCVLRTSSFCAYLKIRGRYRFLKYFLFSKLI